MANGDERAQLERAFLRWCINHNIAVSVIAGTDLYDSLRNAFLSGCKYEHGRMSGKVIRERIRGQRRGRVSFSSRRTYAET